MRWHLLLTPPLDGAENMALDEALLSRARTTGECVLRVYSWSVPTLSFGRHQAARPRYDATRLRDMGVGVVRRPTGGRAVLHHREITYSVTAPLAPFGPLRDAYARINALLMGALATLGVGATIATPRTRAPLPGGAPCFEEPTDGELVLGGRKLVGSAQWREGEALLQHGSILIDDDQGRIAELSAEPTWGAPTPRAATLREALGRAPSPDEFIVALRDAVVTHEDARASHIAINAALRDGMRQALGRYSDERWTWRR